MALFGRGKNVKPEQPSEPVRNDAPARTAAQPRKDRPTPSRRDAEAARRQRVMHTMTPREARRETSRRTRVDRMKAMAARESAPEKVLMRDYIDSRFSLGEFLLPSLVVILALSFLTSLVPNITLFSVVLMYTFILAVLLDGFVMWRGFKKVLAQRLPHTATRGLVLYGMNRMIQIRRFRIPPPRVKRGEGY